MYLDPILKRIAPEAGFRVYFTLFLIFATITALLAWFT